MERKLQEVHPLLTLCGQIVENWQGNPIQKESLRVFFLVLQVTHYLDAGQVRVLCFSQLPSENWAERELPKKELIPTARGFGGIFFLAVPCFLLMQLNFYRF